MKNEKRRLYRDDDLKVSLVPAMANQKDIVADEFKEIRQTTIETAQRFMAPRKLKSILSPMQIFAVAAYQVTYDPQVCKVTEAERRRWHYGEDAAEAGEPVDDICMDRWVILLL